MNKVDLILYGILIYLSKDIKIYNETRGLVNITVRGNNDTGPENERCQVKDPETNEWVVKEDIFESNLETAAEIIASYCEKYGSRIEPYDGSIEEIPVKEDEK